MLFSRAPFSLREAIQGIKNNLAIHILAAGTISFSLLTLGIFMITVINLDRTFNAWNREMQIIVYLDQESSPGAIEQAGENISQMKTRIRCLFATFILLSLSNIQAIRN